MRAKNETQEQVSRLMQQFGYDTSDYASLGVSNATFPDGSHYAINVIAFNSPTDLKLFLKLAESKAVPINRVACTKGAFFLRDEEIIEMLGMCAEKNIEIGFGLSNRAEYDPKSTFRRTAYGLLQGRRLDNLDAITKSVEEAFRLKELGVKNIILYDIGVLSLLNDIRAKGLLEGITFSCSSHNNTANYLIAKIAEDNGADYAVLPSDIKLPMLHMVRKYCQKLIPHVSIDVYNDRGGFMRINEAPMIVSCASPVILKFGASVHSGPYANINEQQMLEILRIIQATIDFINKETKFKQLSNSFRIEECKKHGK